MLKVYVSGPMTNIPEFNFPTFDEVTAVCRSMGWEVVSPAEHDRELYPVGPDTPGYLEGNVTVWSEAVGFRYAGALAWDLKTVTEMDAVVMLPGWENSSGAKAERFTAEVTGKLVFIAERAPDADGPMVWSITEDPIQKRLSVVVAA